MPATAPFCFSDSYISPMTCTAGPSRIPMALPAHLKRWIREEAAMAAITFNAAHNAAGRLGTMLVAMRETIGALVSYRMRLTAAEIEQARRESTPPGNEPAGVDPPFQPLDAGIVSDAIPAFFIGRNSQGFWVARETKGRIGGIFLLQSSALSFARTHSGPAGCATILLSERFELDLKNNGNPLAPYLGSLMRAAMRGRRRTVAIIEK
jgi:hypothetical protein